jgi:UDP-N-acetylmuramoylalanine--D-glutamate ligase
MDFKNKKVLVFGFGILGGGLATANWLLKQGAKLTITDLKNKEQLANSLSNIEGQIELRLGGHSKKDIDDNEIIVLNPDVPIRSEFVQYALTQGKELTNEALIFFSEFKKPIVAITGTRGKTTTTAWTSYLLGSKFKSSIAGNSTTHPYLKVLDTKNDLDIASVELPSFLLELFDYSKVSPHIAIITNIHQEHLNRHQTMEEYSRVKVNIFKNQTSSDSLILNYDNNWTKSMLQQNPRAKILFFSSKPLPAGTAGVWCDGNQVYFQRAGGSEAVLVLDDSVLARGEHNVQNLLPASLASHLAGCSWLEIQSRLNSLPEIPFRQEIVFQDEKLTIVNDTTATSPDGAIQALKRFGGSETVLITGGTDRNLDFTEWADMLPKIIQPGNIIFLAGSATDKVRSALGDVGGQITTHETLDECFRVALKKASQYEKSVILFSPASKSFEKFKNEFDRGEQFNELVKKYVNQPTSIKGV